MSKPSIAPELVERIRAYYAARPENAVGGALIDAEALRRALVVTSATLQEACENAMHAFAALSNEAARIAALLPPEGET